MFFNENGKTAKYVLQKVNTEAFKNPEGLMSNIVAVTSYIRKKNEEMNIPWADRGTLTFLPCKDGKYFFIDEQNNCWRMYHYIDNVFTYNCVDDEQVFVMPVLPLVISRIFLQILTGQLFMKQLRNSTILLLVSKILKKLLQKTVQADLKMLRLKLNLHYPMKKKLAFLLT